MNGFLKIINWLRYLVVFGILEINVSAYPNISKLLEKHFDDSTSWFQPKKVLVLGNGKKCTCMGYHPFVVSTKSLSETEDVNLYVTDFAALGFIILMPSDFFDSIYIEAYPTFVDEGSEIRFLRQLFRLIKQNGKVKVFENYEFSYIPHIASLESQGWSMLKIIVDDDFLRRETYKDFSAVPQEKLMELAQKQIINQFRKGGFHDLTKRRGWLKVHRLEAHDKRYEKLDELLEGMGYFFSVGLRKSF